MLDDGTAENSVGLNNGGDLWWANQFTAAAGGELITKIQVAFGSSATPSGVTIGDTYSVHVWEDPDDDGNPADLILVSSEVTTISEPPDANLFDEILLSTPAAVSGSFFVGAIISHTTGQKPAAFDQTTAAGLSWLAGGTSGSIDPANVQGTATGISPTLVDEYSPGNWLIRAVGTTQ